MNAHWDFIERLIYFLIDAGLDVELACDVVGRLQIDLPEGVDDLDEMVASHAIQLLRSYDRLRAIIKPLFLRPYGPSLSRLNPTATSMFLNMACQHRVTAEEDLAREELTELQYIFKLRWDADRRAIKRWQEAAPGRELVWPDHTDLLVWLLDELEAKSGGP
jgi:hypothetical protein